MARLDWWGNNRLRCPCTVLPVIVRILTTENSVVSVVHHCPIYVRVAVLRMTGPPISAVAKARQMDLCLLAIFEAQVHLACLSAVP